MVFYTFSSLCDFVHDIEGCLVVRFADEEHSYLLICEDFGGGCVTPWEDEWVGEFSQERVEFICSEGTLWRKFVLLLIEVLEEFNALEGTLYRLSWVCVKGVHEFDVIILQCNGLEDFEFFVAFRFTKICKDNLGIYLIKLKGKSCNSRNKNYCKKKDISVKWVFKS